MPSQAQIDANRKNAQRSTGPRTREGKSRVRFNALKDGATAKSPVIPGEDPAEFQARIDTWTKDLAPTNSVERYLVEYAARVSWQLDRIDRAHAARLRSNIRNTTTDKAHNIQQRVTDLARRLFHDPRGPITSYPHFEYKPHLIPGQPRISWTGLVDDPNHPAALVHELESTEPGCHWLLARWTDLRRRLDLSLSWQPPDKLKAIRLLGHQPLDALDTSEIATIFFACHALDPAYDDPFHELWKELSAGEKLVCDPRLDARGYDDLEFDGDDPDDKARARDWLRNRATRAIKRLQRLLANHQDRAEADAADEADRLAFDDSPNGERLRRYQATCSRSLIRTLDLLRKSKQPTPAPAPPDLPPTVDNPQKSKPNPQPAPTEPPSIAAEPELPIPAPVTVTSEPDSDIPRNGSRQTVHCSPSPRSRGVTAASAMSPVKRSTPLARSNSPPCSSTHFPSLCSLWFIVFAFLQPAQSNRNSAANRTRILCPLLSLRILCGSLVYPSSQGVCANEPYRATGHGGVSGRPHTPAKCQNPSVHPSKRSDTSSNLMDCEKIGKDLGAQAIGVDRRKSGTWVMVRQPSAELNTGSDRVSGHLERWSALEEESEFRRNEMSGKPSNGQLKRARRTSPLLESLEDRRLLSISAGGGVFSSKNRVFKYVSPTGGHVTIQIIGIGTLAGTSVDSSGDLHIVFSGTNTYSKITGNVSGGGGFAPLASIVNKQLENESQTQSLSGLGGNVLQSVLLGKFDLVAGGNINLTSGVNSLTLDSTSPDSQIHLRELPSTIQPNTLQAEIKSAATSGTSTSSSSSFSSSSTSSKSSTSSTSSGTTASIPLQDTNVPYVYTSAEGVETTYVRTADGAVTLTAVSGSFTAQPNLVESLPTGQPMSLPPAPPGVIIHIKKIQGTLTQPVDLQTDSKIFGYDPTTGQLLRFDLNLANDTGSVDPTFTPIAVPGSPAAVGLNVGWNGSQLDVLISSGTTVYAYNATTGAAVGSFVTTNPINSIGSTDTVTVLGSYATNQLQMIDLHLSLQTGTAQPVEDNASPLTPTAGLTLLGGLTGLPGSNSIYAAVAGHFDSLLPSQEQLGTLSASTTSVATSSTGGVPFSKFNSQSYSATTQNGNYLTVQPNPPNSSQDGAALGAVDQSTALLTGASNGVNTLTLSSGSIALTYPDRLAAISETFRTGLSGSTLIDVQGDIQSIRGESANGLVLNDTGNLNLIKFNSTSNSTIVAQPVSHLEIGKRTTTSVLSTMRDVDGRNYVTVSTNLKPIGPVSQTGD